jgi:hypothetical protein
MKNRQLFTYIQTNMYTDKIIYKYMFCFLIIKCNFKSLMYSDVQLAKHFFNSKKLFLSCPYQTVMALIAAIIFPCTVDL